MRQKQEPPPPPPKKKKLLLNMTFMITCLNNKEMRFYMTFSRSYNLKENISLL